MKKLYLIDASIYVFRAWFSMDEGIIDKKGRPVNAVYGFAYFILQLLEREKPTHIAVLFDESLDSSFRNTIYPDYKANREPAPPELKQQFQLCRQLCRALGITEKASKRYEADDLIGSLSERYSNSNNQVVIVSRDKDLVQLLKQDDLFWDFADDRRFDCASATDHFGVRPEQMADFLGLAGDSVDNIPGVPGVGKKTAQVLLGHFIGLNDLYQGLDQVINLGLRGASRIQGLLEQHRELAFISRQLAQIKCDIKLPLEPQDLRWSPQIKKMERFFNTLGVGQRLLPRYRKVMEESA